jgi:demethylmenaquinone methyltransferase/2-methoxy-6-polyprenyl-1,4-benzoquinol methylase
VREYYDTRAPEYDEWYLGVGRFADRVRPDWDVAVAELEERLAALPPASTLDVACGTGFLTRHLRGSITGLDQSERMLAIAQERLPDATFVTGDALSLPFDDGAFERLFTGHFYGHLEGEDRARFLSEARRVASEVIIVDSASRADHAAEEWQERILNDGSVFAVYKRYFDGPALADELGGGSVLLANDWFVMVGTTGAPVNGPR